jgi:hypothetical protein
MLLVNAIVEQQTEAGTGIDPKVVAALWTNHLVVFKGLAPNDLAATIALLPKAFGANVLFSIAAAFHRRLLSSEPRHCEQNHGSMRGEAGHSL